MTHDMLLRVGRQQAAEFERLTFLWVTDSHISVAGAYPESDAALQSSISEANVNQPSAYIHSGDIGEGTEVSMARGFGFLDTALPIIFSPGNHDIGATVGGETVVASSLTAFFGGGDPPFYRSFTYQSTNGYFRLLVLELDGNVSAADGHYIGQHPPEYVPVDAKCLGATQLAWVAATLAADTVSNAILIVEHYGTNGDLTDLVSLADILQADGRPAIAFCGHGHQNASVTYQSTTDAAKQYTFYKAPALSGSGAYVWVVLRKRGPRFVVDLMQIRNFTDPGWTISSPFTVLG